MKHYKILFLLIFTLTAGAKAFAQTDFEDFAETKPCSQDKPEKLQLIKKAEENQFNIRYIEIVGTTYTRYQTFRERWAKDFEEGGIFTRKILLKSIEGTNKLKTINPITLDNIEVRLEENDARGWNAIDIIICVTERKKN